MDFALTEEQQLFAETVRRFAEDKLKDGALKRAHSKEYPWDSGARCSPSRVSSASRCKEEDGGMGGTLMDAVIAIEQMALVCPKSADIVQAGNFGAIRTFAEYAIAEQKAKWLPELLSGEMVISLGMSEPDAGSAATDLRTSAKEDGEHYVLKGQKVFGTHSRDASHLP